MPSQEHKFAIFRIEKLHTPQEISRVGNHNDRTGKLPANVDPTRVMLNCSYTPNDKPLLERVTAKLAGMKFRKDAVRAVEIFCGFSPGAQEGVHIDEWAAISLDYVKKKFGAKNLVSAVLHLDEQTPHMHFVIVPIIEGRLAAKRIFGTRKQLHQMQNEYYSSVKKFGFHRGTRGSTRPHLSMREIYEGTHEGLEILQEAMDAIPKKTITGSWETYSKKLKGHLEAALEPLTTAKTQATLAEIENKSLRKLVNESELATQAEKNRLRELDLCEVAYHLLGYEGVKQGKSSVFEDDARRIVITGNAFKDEKSDARAERGAISLTRHILETDFETSLRILAQHFPWKAEVVQAEAIRESEATIKASVKKAKGEPVDHQTKIDCFAKEDKGKLHALREYLEEIKKIPKGLIKSLINNACLWANRWGSACFMKANADKSRTGVSIVGTTTKSMQSIGPKDTFFTIGEFAKSVVVTVAPDPIKAIQIHAESGQPVIAVDSIDQSAEAFEFLRAYGITKFKLAEDATYNKETKKAWQSVTKYEGFQFIEDEVKPSTSKKKEKIDPEQSEL